MRTQQEWIRLGKWECEKGDGLERGAGKCRFPRCCSRRSRRAARPDERPSRGACRRGGGGGLPHTGCLRSPACVSRLPSISHAPLSVSSVCVFRSKAAAYNIPALMRPICIPCRFPPVPPSTPVPPSAPTPSPPPPPRDHTHLRAYERCKGHSVSGPSPPSHSLSVSDRESSLPRRRCKSESALISPVGAPAGRPAV